MPLLAVNQNNIFMGSGCASLVMRSLPIPEVHGSNPVIGKNLYPRLTVNCIEKTKIKKRGREWPFFKKTMFLQRAIPGLFFFIFVSSILFIIDS